MFKLASLLVLLVSSINALTINKPKDLAVVNWGMSFDMQLDREYEEEKARKAIVIFKNPSGTHKLTVEIGQVTHVNLPASIVGYTVMVAYPYFESVYDNDNAAPFNEKNYAFKAAVSSIIVNPTSRPTPAPTLTPRPSLPSYIPCYNPCYNPYRPICNIPRPRRESCNIPRPRCHIRESENSESVDFQMYYDSGLSLYLDQQAKAIEQFQREYDQHLIEQTEAETNVKVEA